MSSDVSPFTIGRLDITLAAFATYWFMNSWIQANATLKFLFYAPIAGLMMAAWFTKGSTRIRIWWGLLGFIACYFLAVAIASFVAAGQ